MQVTDVRQVMNTSASNHPRMSFDGLKVPNPIILLYFERNSLTIYFLFQKYITYSFLFVSDRGFKLSGLTNEEILTKNGIFMGVNSWYEFFYKVVSFKLIDKSSSFVTNNMILSLNFNNPVMKIKNLKNYSYFDLNEYRLEK